MSALMHDRFETWRVATEALSDQGYRLPPQPPGAGRWVRIPAAGKGVTNRSASVTITADGGAVHLRDFANDVRHTVQAERVGRRDPLERARLDATLARRQAEQRVALEVARTRAVSAALKRFVAGGPGDRHPYVVAKGLASAHGARQLDDELLVLGRDADGRPAFVQRIIGDGTRKFVMKGTSFVGAFVTFGTPAAKSTLVIGTGWATSAVLFEESGYPTLAAMSDGNLEGVARIMRERFPSADIIIAGDDDREMAGNSGRRASSAAARAIGARLALPTFCESCDRECSDFADLRACERRRTGGKR